MDYEERKKVIQAIRHINSDDGHRKGIEILYELAGMKELQTLLMLKRAHNVEISKLPKEEGTFKVRCTGCGNLVDPSDHEFEDCLHAIEGEIYMQDMGAR